MGDILHASVRRVAVHDRAALAALFEAVGLFTPDELIELAELLQRYFAGDLGRDHHWLAFDDGALVGAAYYAPQISPERTALGVWNLYFIGIQPGRQGSGCGGALIRSVEETLAAEGATEVLVETSGLASFEQTRAFYRKHGYCVIARVAVAYKAGDDKIIFSKRLTAARV